MTRFQGTWSLSINDSGTISEFRIGLVSIDKAYKISAVSDSSLFVNSLTDQGNARAVRERYMHLTTVTRVWLSHGSVQ